MIKRIPLRPILLSTLVCLVIAGCKKDNTRPAKTRFPIGYRFINEGDKNVKAIILDMTTFYPFDSVDVRGGDSISFLQWQRGAYNDVPVDGAVEVQATRSGYSSCTLQLKLDVVFREARYSPLYAATGRSGGGDLADGWTRARAFVADPVTVQSASDGFVIFRWPSDTAKFKEVIYY